MKKKEGADLYFKLSPCKQARRVLPVSEATHRGPCAKIPGTLEYGCQALRAN
jgi:hypothetical protein